jgi:UDP-N-acetylglucosamine--N-acetylmuramyl-(pentapeptide) pyrophosphoryl-undecaprenol N-acetylglucosamine transferase
MSTGENQKHRGVIVLAAGGTGGHLFPAQALAEELVRRGFCIHLMTDERVRDYGSGFPAQAVHQIPAATLSLSQPWLVPGRLLRLWSGFRKARSVLRQLEPVAVAGFGGYPSFPPILAAAALGIPSAIHDQNAVMGRANRLLARFATVVASSFPTLALLPSHARAKLVVTGNPVRDVVLAETGAPYRLPAPGVSFNLLVFGGSQGARFFADIMPQAMRHIPEDVRRSLAVTQQCRPEDMDRVKSAYEALGIVFELQPFFLDMPRRIAGAHLVICRSGASTVAELGAIGRPAIMVPLPHALDNDQLRNAESFAAAGGGWVMQQNTLTAADLAAFLTRLRYQENELAAAAAAALGHGRPDAAKRLADVVEGMAIRGGHWGMGSRDRS